MVGKAIKYYRKKAGLKQSELASMCGMSTNSLCQIEKENTMANKATIGKLCKALNVTTYQLMYKSIPENILKQLIYDDTK